MNTTPWRWSLLVLSIAACHAHATVYYWDPESTATPSAANLAGTWDTTSAQWSTTSAQTATPAAWSSGVAACFAAGSTSVTTPFTVTVNSQITIAGIFNGALTPPGVNVTLSGTGSLVLASGADAFDTGGSGSTTVAIPMTGAGQVALEGTRPVYFNAANTYTGGTILGYPGVANFTGAAFFNNSHSFGTGAIQMSTSGGGSSLAVEGTAAITLPNAVTAAAVSLSITGNPAGLTFSGPWNLAATPLIGCAGAGNLVTISGVMSGAGGFTKYNTGTLVLSGANTYTGGTTISNGVLSVTADNNLGAASSTANYNIFLSGGTLNASNSFTLNPKRLISLSANSTLSVSAGKTLTYAGVITGPGALVKSGPGTLVLGGANGYNGTTTVSGGTLEADCTSGSSTSTNLVLLQPNCSLSGTGLVSGPVSGTGNLVPGTPAGPGMLTLGNGLTLSSGGTLVWNLSTNDMGSGYSSLSLIGGNLNLGGASRLSLTFSGAATAPATNNPFWQTQEAWTIVDVNGAGANPNLTRFSTLLNGNYAAGNFTNYVAADGSVVLLYQPNFSVFDALYDAGHGFFGGENLKLTNVSGLTLYAWASSDPTLPVSQWPLVGQMQEQSLAPGLPGYSQYAVNVSPTVSPTYVVAGNSNTGPYNQSAAPCTILTSDDLSTFAVGNTNLVLVPPPSPVLLPSSGYSSGSGFQLQFSCDTNVYYLIQASTNLSTWSNISSGTVTASPVTFQDPQATSYRSRFYRVILP